MIAKAVAILLTAFIPLGASATAAQERGRRIAEQVQRGAEGFGGEYAELQLEILRGEARTAIALTLRTLENPSDHERSVVEVRGPTAMRGMRLLTWSHRRGDDESWLYLPAVNRIHPIRGARQGDAFLGSDFAYEDLAPLAVEKFTYRYLGEVREAGRAAWNLERIPAGRASSYGKQIMVVDAVMRVPLSIESYDARGRLWKTAKFAGHERFDRWWRPMRVEMVNHRTGGHSILRWHRRELGREFSPEDFEREVLASWVLANAMEKP